jgi:iron complex transport system substrate-binding protein
MSAGGRAIDALNAAALSAALATAGLAGWVLARPATAAMPAPAAASAAGSIVDGDGTAVAVRDYRRIVSLVPELDDALAAMGLTDRLAAVSAYSREHGVASRQLRGVPGTVPTGASVEDVLALRPDLVLASPISDPGRTARIRAAGVAVFRIGQERGAQDAAAAMRQVAALCGEPAAGTALAERFLRRLAHVADPRLPRLRACYVAWYDGKLFGGAAGTSYHDLIESGGLTDAASERGYRDWPEYRVEDLIAIAPEVLVTGAGMGAHLAELPAAGDIPAIAHHRIIEVDPALLSGPGLSMLDAAEAIARAREALP